MKKFFPTLVALVSVFAISSISFAQLPNGGFETWTNGNPNRWLGFSNFGGLITTNITKSNDAHSGSAAVRGEVVALSGGGIMPPILTAGDGGGGFACNSHIGSLIGYYKFVPAGSAGDRFQIDVIVYKGASFLGVIGSGLIDLTASATSYTKFTVPISYIADGVPDSCYIMIAIDAAEGADDPTVGSYFIVDDISYGPVTGIAENGNAQPSVFKLNQNYPNPFNPTTDLSFTVPSNGRATLKVFNVMGQEVASLFNQTAVSGNIYHATFNAAGLASGLYFSRLQFISTNGVVKEAVGKMILAK
jgi:hypothetical protein